MIKSLKRKKPAAGPTGKGAAKKAKTATSTVKATAQIASDSTVTSISLEHLIDRPYVEYNAEADDIGGFHSN